MELAIPAPTPKARRRRSPSSPQRHTITKTITLPSGGTIALQGYLDLFALTDAERSGLFALVDAFAAFAAQVNGHPPATLLVGTTEIRP